jgi:hypothetical protein
METLKTELAKFNEASSTLGCELAQLVELTNGDADLLSKILYSVENYDADIDDIINGNANEHDGYYYGGDYIVTDDTQEIMHVDDAHFCEYDEVYICGDVVEVHIDRRTSQYWSEDNANDNAYYYNNSYYTSDAMNYYDLLFDVNGEIAHIDDVYYWESDGEYHYEPEPQQGYVREYHDGNRLTHYVNFSDNAKFRIGFEIEKEDVAVKESIFIDDFETEYPHWRKEKDGSLNPESGYELVSPAIELDSSKVAVYLNSLPNSLKQHINADYSKSCGGHINVSDESLTGRELYEQLQGYTPLFHALYYGRIDNTYCAGKPIDALKDSSDKYQSIAIHSNRIEYRIVSAVKNIENLIWRTKLIELIMNNRTSCPRRAFYNIHKIFKPLLLEVYGERFNELSDRIIKMTAKFEKMELQGIPE